MVAQSTFGDLTLMSNPIRGVDIIELYSKKVSDYKKYYNRSGTKILADKIPKNTEEKSEIILEKFGELTNINDDYYRLPKKVVSRIDDAKIRGKIHSLL